MHRLKSSPLVDYIIMVLTGGSWGQNPPNGNHVTGKSRAPPMTFRRAETSSENSYMCINMCREENASDDRPMLNFDKTDTVYTLITAIHRPISIIYAGLKSYFFPPNVPIYGYPQ
jgi:hypothetical protein